MVITGYGIGSGIKKKYFEKSRKIVMKESIKSQSPGSIQAGQVGLPTVKMMLQGS